MKNTLCWKARWEAKAKVATIITVAAAGSLLLGCILLAPANAQVGICDDDVYAEIDGSTVRLYHDGSEYNCCPDHFDYDVDISAELILVTEHEVLLEPCDCICCFDLGVEIEDVPAGTYNLIFSWIDYGTYEWLEWPLQVTVPDIGQGGLLIVGAVLQSDCYWETTSVTEPPGDPAAEPSLEPRRFGSWTQIKTLYR